jgi:hypothetical protein
MNTKLETLVRSEGFASVEDLLEGTITDSVSPPICTNAGCSYTCEMEPDQDRGYCDVCNTNSMQSALVLAGIDSRRQVSPILPTGE